MMPPVKRALEFKAESEVEITVATNAGACFGVVRAIKLGKQAARGGKQDQNAVYSFGALIHNPMVVEQLQNEGVKTVSESGEVESGTVILRSHGVKREIEAEFVDRGIKIVDATCPLVKKPQRLARALGEKGYFLILVGDEGHPEVKGVLSYFGRPDYIVTYKPDDIVKVPAGTTKVGVIAQTTIEVGVLNAVVESAKQRFAEVAVYNTICDATSIRQTEAESLSQKADVMVVVGGRNSSNTAKLVKICKKHQADTHLIEELHELDPQWFVGKKRIGITGGASTPQDYVDLVGTKVAEIVQTQIH